MSQPQSFSKNWPRHCGDCSTAQLFSLPSPAPLLPPYWLISRTLPDKFPVLPAPSHSLLTWKTTCQRMGHFVQTTKTYVPGGLPSSSIDRTQQCMLGRRADGQTNHWVSECFYISEAGRLLRAKVAKEGFLEETSPKCFLLASKAPISECCQFTTTAFSCILVYNTA